MTGPRGKQVRIGKQHWQKVVSLLKKYATPRSRELESQLSAVRRDYRELGLRASKLASEGNTARKTLEKAKQQIDSVHGELGAAYQSRDQLAVELQKQLESLKTGIQGVQAGHRELVKGFAERDRQFETLAANVEAHQSGTEELQGVIKNLQQRITSAALDYTAVTEKSHTLSSHLDEVRNELDSIRNSHLGLLPDIKSLEQRTSEAERNDLAAKDQNHALAVELAGIQQQVKALEGKLEGEHERQQANLNTIEERLTRVQIEQESLINIQSGLTDSLRKNRRWAAVAVGIAFLMGALTGISKIRDIQEDVPEQAAVTDESRPSLEPQVSQRYPSLLEDSLSLTGKSVENAAFETKTAPIDNTEAGASEPLSDEQAGQIDKLDRPPEDDTSAPLKRPLTPGQAIAALQTFEAKVFFEENAMKEGVISLPSGLQYKVLRTGHGKSPGQTDMVILHYRGSLPDGREFDSSYAEKAPAAYRVDQVIAGWREALQRMQEGAQWELYIPPELAHGAGTQRTPDFLPLIYQIELISVSKAGASNPP